MIIAAPNAFAQSSATGTLTGTVADPSGGVLPGVTVTAQNVATGVSRTAITDGGGNWTITTIPTGRYELGFELDSFKRLVRNDITVEAAVARTINVSLEVGSLSEAVTVTADAALLTRDHRRNLPQDRWRGADQRSDIDAQLHAPAVCRSWCQRRSAAGPHQRHREHLAVGERHADDEHQPVLQRHRRDEHHVERRLADRQHFARAGDARRGQAADEPVRCVDRTFGRRQFPARSRGAARTRFTAAGSSTSSTKSSTPTTSSTTRTGSTSPRRAGTRAVHDWRPAQAESRCSSSAVTSAPNAETGFVPTASSITVVPAALGLIAGDRTKDNLLAGLRRAEPRDSCVNSQGAVRKCHRHGVHF